MNDVTQWVGISEQSEERKGLNVQVSIKDSIKLNVNVPYLIVKIYLYRHSV